MTANGRTLPEPHPVSGLPAAVRVHEVGPRDGLQAESRTVPTSVKAELCRRLIDAGVTSLEVTSFVSPRWVPQLADAGELMAALSEDEALRPIRSMVLTPNEWGYRRALEADADEIAVFVSATETFARKNLNASVDEAIAMALTVIADATAREIPVRGYVSMCFGDPWEGRVSTTAVVDVVTRLVDAGCSTVALGDTIGVATPGHVVELLDSLVAAGVTVDRIALHFHDTYGQALANVYAALGRGVAEFDSSVGGLGKCPYAKGATGNLATEDLVWMLEGLGIATGLDLDALVDTSLWLSEATAIAPASRVVRGIEAARRDRPGDAAETAS